MMACVRPVQSGFCKHGSTRGKLLLQLTAERDSLSSQGRTPLTPAGLCSGWVKPLVHSLGNQRVEKTLQQPTSLHPKDLSSIFGLK